MPPVMGAGAFIMADFLRIPYSQIVLVAILPAVLFFGALYLVVHLEAGRTNMARLDDNEVPKLSQALMERGHMLIPLLWLAVLVVSGFGMADATMQAVALTILIGSCRASTRAAPSQVVTALIETAKRAVSVALPCALASIIVSVIAFSGLGTKFTSILIDFAGGSFIIMLVAAMVGSVVLGAGMPTTSAYIMSAVLIAPGDCCPGGQRPFSTFVHLLLCDPVDGDAPSGPCRLCCSDNRKNGPKQHRRQSDLDCCPDFPDPVHILCPRWDFAEWEHCRNRR